MTVFAAGQQLLAEVHDTAAFDRVTGSVSLPVSLDPGTVWQVAGAADDRHFVVAVPVYGTSSLRLFGLSLSSAGRPVLSRHTTAQWNGDVFRGVALSPDGTVAALAFTNSAKLTGTVAAVMLSDGSAKVWSGAQAPGFLPGDLSFVSGTSLAVPWVHYISPADAVLSGVRTLDVSQPGGSLLASRLVTFASPPPVPHSAMVTAGGREIIASICPGGTGPTITAQVAVLSGIDGHLIRVLRTEKQTVQPGPAGTATSQPLALVTCPLLSVDATGLHVLTEAFTFGRLDGLLFRRLPPDAVQFDAAW